MAAKTQLSAIGTPGRRYSFTAKDAMTITINPASTIYAMAGRTKISAIDGVTSISAQKGTTRIGA